MNSSRVQDMTCLAEGVVYPADFDKTGLNLNEMVVGGTGCGKSVSVAYSRLVHTSNSSVVVPITKKAIRDKFAGMFRNRGYQVVELDFTKNGRSNLGYDPMDYIRNTDDTITLAKNIVEAFGENRGGGRIDPYWYNSAASVLAAEIELIRLNAAYAGKRPRFIEVIELHRSIRFHNTAMKEMSKINIDYLFDAAEERYPGNAACELWRTIKNLSVTTASCILSTLNASVDMMFTETVMKVLEKEECFAFKRLGEEKTAVFITTPPMNKASQGFVNLLYADLFRELFETAEERDCGRLAVPVHIICDDFACGSRILDFEDYISVFRAAGISVTLLLQSESQLISMYGEHAATTIINNCDTYVYMGGTDMKTCQNVSYRLDKPLHMIMSMPLEQVVVFRRGAEPIVSRRYQTLEDPVYKELVGDDEERFRQ